MSKVIELGDKVRDRVTGYTGIVIGEATWLYGCKRLVIQSQDLKDGKPVDSLNIDEPQAELLEKNVVPAVAPAPISYVPPLPQEEARKRGQGGPQPNAPTRPTASR